MAKIVKLPNQKCHNIFKEWSNYENSKNYNYIIFFYEDFPKTLTADEINKKGSYADYTDSITLSYWPWDLKNMMTDNIYSIPLKFDKPGLYYVHIYLSDEEFTSGTASTKGKTQGSGLVIRID